MADIEELSEPAESDESESPESSSTLTLDVSGDDTFEDAQAGDKNVCITVYGTVESNDGSTLVLNVDRAELMPEGHGHEEDDGESEMPSKNSKHVIAIMIGKPKG